MTTYRHCELQKRGATQVVWIPTKFAILGKVLRYRPPNPGVCGCGSEEWDDGWEVTKVGDEDLEETNLHPYEYKHHRAQKQLRNDKNVFYLDWW